MKLLYLFIFIPYFTIAQSKLIDKSRYDKLVIIDQHNNNYSVIYGRIYEIDLLDSLHEIQLVEEYKSPDTIYSPFYKEAYADWGNIKNQKLHRPLGTIDKNLIDELISIINTPGGINNFLEYYQIDSTWLIKNRDRLYALWLSFDNKPKKYQTGYAKYILDNFNAFKRLCYSHILQTNSADYSSIDIAFESNIDTIVFSTSGQSSFLIPWNYDTLYKNYNPYLSLAVSEIIPKDLAINQSKLCPTLEEFEYGVIWQLYFKSRFVKRKNFKRFLKEKKADNNGEHS